MFPNGWPGRGLLLLRVANGAYVIHQQTVSILGSQRISPIAILVAVAGATLVIGLWTPITGVILALLEMVLIYNGTSSPEDATLSASVALSTAMLGPGVWSADALLFGRHRLEFPPNRN